MKARLFQFISSPFCAKVRKLLEYKGVEYEVFEVDYLERKELLAASGQLMVPALSIDGETIAGSDRIALRLEERCPEPTIFPRGFRGLHQALAHYIDNALEDALFRAAIPDEIAHWRSRGSDREAMWRLVRERKYGDGFCDRMVREHAAHWDSAMAALAPFEEQLGAGPFLTSRIGLADFCLYGQLYYFAFRGELKIPGTMPNLRAFFGRIDRLLSSVEPPPG